MHAVLCRNETAVNILLAASAKHFVTTRDGDTPLHLAARAGSIAICCRLVEEGADIHAFNNENKRPVDCALQFWECQAMLVQIESDRLRLQEEISRGGGGGRP